MRSSKKALALLVLLGLVALAAPVRADAEAGADDDDVYDDEEKPTAPKAFLMARRKLSEKRPQVGKPIKVLVELHNAGSSSAIDVTAKEETWNEDAFVTSGQLVASFDTIPAGTTYSFTYTVTPQFAVERYEHRPTLVTYTAEEGGSAITTTSPWLPFRAFTAAELYKIKALRMGSSLTLGGLNTVADWAYAALALMAAAVAYLGYTGYRTLTDTRRKSKRRSALKDLGVTEEDLKSK